MKKVKTGIVLAIITLLCKIVALLLTLVFSYIFGANNVTDAYYAASNIPNLINSSLCVCSLTLFIPIYMSCRQSGEKDSADIFSSVVLNSYTIFNFLLTIIIIVFSNILAYLVGPNFDDITHIYTRNLIVLLSLSFSVTISTNVLINICNANKSHILQNALTLLNHVVTLILMVIFSKKYGIYSYPIICLISWIVQFIIQYLYSRRFFVHRFRINYNNPYFKKMLLLSIPVIIATSAEQINLAIDNIICSFLPTGSLSYLGYAQRIHVAVLGSFTAILMTMYYPLISEKFSSKDFKGLFNDIRVYLDILFIIILPMTFFLFTNSDLIIGILYGRGAISSYGVSIVSNIFRLYSLTLLFSSLKELFTRLFYVKKNTKIPMVANIISLILNIILSLILVKFVGIYGIVYATIISTFVAMILEAILLLKPFNSSDTLSNRLMIVRDNNIVNIKNIFQVVFCTFISVVILILFRKFLFFKSDFINLLLSFFIFFVVYLSFMIVKKNSYFVDLFNNAIKNKFIKR